MQYFDSYRKTQRSLNKKTNDGIQKLIENGIEIAVLVTNFKKIAEDYLQSSTCL